jgi:hypothetical protein
MVNETACSRRWLSDGGYLMAIAGIYQAELAPTTISKIWCKVFF